MTIDGLRTTTFDTIMRDDADRAVLARKILEWITDWGGRMSIWAIIPVKPLTRGEKPTGGSAFP